MKNLKWEARKAGLWYLFMGISGVIGLIYVPSQILVEGDFDATVTLIREKETLFRWGIMANILCQTSFLFLALQFRRLFQEVSDYWSKLLQVLVTAAVPLAIFNTILSIGALYCAKGLPFLSGFDSRQLMSFSLLFLKINEFGVTAIELFWGLWLMPLGVLFIKAPFMPKLIGFLLLINALAYLFEWFLKGIDSPLHDLIIEILMIPLSLGEFSAILWLLIMGTKKTDHP